MNSPTEKIDYALWMLRTAAKSSAFQWTIALLMMAGGWGCAIQASFGSHKPEEKLPWSVVGLIIAAPSIFVLRHAQERGNWAEDGRSVLRWSRAQWMESLTLPPPQNELSAININASGLPQALSLPPVRNLSSDIALNDGHIALVSKTRSGKTTLLIGTIEEAKAAGHQVILLDGKGDERLRAIPGIRYLQVNRADRVPPMFEVLGEVLKVLERRQDGEKGAPISLFIDEFNLIRDSASEIKVKTDNGKEGLDVLFSRQTKRVLLQGAAAKIYLRASSHTSRVEDWGWNTGVLDSLSFLALGRNGAYESIEDLIRFQVSGNKAKAFQELLDGYRSLDMGGEPLVLSLLAPVGFCRAPRIDQAALPMSPTPIALPGLSDQQIDALASDVVQELYDPRASLERAFQADAPADIDPSEMSEEERNRLIDEKRSKSKTPLSKPAQAILDKYKAKEMYGTWIDAKWVKNYVFRSKDLSNFSPEQIRDFLTELAASSIGSVEGEGAGLRWYFDVEE